MKRDIRQWWQEQREKPLVSRLLAPLRWFWGLLCHNLGIKLISLVLAVLLWNYVVTTDTSITRPKTLTGLTGYVSGQSALYNSGLAMLDNPAESLSSVTVTIEAPQASYSRVTNGTVQVMLDLSNVRTAGTQEVPLRAATTYGRVVDIIPESVSVTFEALDSRSIPVNYQFTGEKSDDYWYSVSRVNPSVLTVSGAASVVRSIANAYVYADVTGLESSTIAALPYTMLDEAGEEIAQGMLNRSTSSISLNLDVTPARSLPVSTDIASVVTGTPAEGYVVHSVTIQPESVTVAAERDLLDGLDALQIEPVSVEGASQSFSARARVSKLTDFKYVSNEQVYVNVTITEETGSGWIEDVGLLFTGVGDGLSVTYEPVRAHVSGPRSAVEVLMRDGVSAEVDLTGLGAGSHACELIFDAERYPDMTFETEPLRVTLMPTERAE